MSCYFSGDDKCDHQIDRAHFIPKQRLKKQGLSKDEIWDERVWTPMCRKHHHMFDHGHLSISRDEIPLDVERYAHEHGIVWSLDRDYGPLVIRCRSQVTSKCHQLKSIDAHSIYGDDGMPDDRTYDPKTMTVVCNSCYVELGCPTFKDLAELERILRG